MNKQDLLFQFYQKKDLLTLNNTAYKKRVTELFDWLKTTDDVAHDQTTKAFPSKHIETKIISRHEGIVSGMEEIQYFFEEYRDISFISTIPDGNPTKKDESIAVLSGDSKTILALERTMLNILQRMMGIATQTQRLMQLVHTSTAAPYISATRKAPWTLLDKKAVANGGGLTHRLTLSDGILIKDNHLEILKKEFDLTTEEQAVTKAVEMTLSKVKNTMVEIEVNTEKGADAAIEVFERVRPTNYLTVLFDNWKPEKAQQYIDKMNKNTKILFEASGTIREENIHAWAKTGVDSLSLGALTHSIQAADLSLEFVG